MIATIRKHVAHTPRLVRMQAARIGAAFTRHPALLLAICVDHTRCGNVYAAVGRPRRSGVAASRGLVIVARFSIVLALLTVLPVSPVAAQRAKVQVGYCAGLKDLEAVKAAGFDYIELETSEIAALSDADFEAAARRIKEVGLPVPVTNLFLPAALKITGPQTDREQQMAYVKKAFGRLSRLGTQIVVFGSGGARQVPDGFAKEDAFKQLVEFGRAAAQEARANGITVAIEPLRRKDSNIINSAAEGLDLATAINDPNFQLMIDFYHLASEQEDPAIVIRAKDHIRHLHIANPRGRVFPQKWQEFDYASFFANLKTIGYDERISVEASTNDLAKEGPLAIALLRHAFER